MIFVMVAKKKNPSTGTESHPTFSSRGFCNTRTIGIEGRTIEPCDWLIFVAKRLAPVALQQCCQKGLQVLPDQAKCADRFQEKMQDSDKQHQISGCGCASLAHSERRSQLP